MEKTLNNQCSATLDEVKGDVHELRGMMDEVKGDVHELRGMMDEVKGDVHELRGMMDEVLSSVNEFADKTERRFNHLEDEVVQIKDVMVTKDYLDEKMSDLRGDLVVMMRKEDNKLMTLVGVLEGKKVLDKSDVKKIYSLEPFAQ